MKINKNLIEFFFAVILNAVSELIFYLLSNSENKISSALLFFIIGIITFLIFSEFLKFTRKKLKKNFSLFTLILSIFGMIPNIDVVNNIANIHFLLLFENIMLVSIFQLADKDFSEKPKEIKADIKDSQKDKFLKKNRKLIFFCVIIMIDIVWDTIFMLFTEKNEIKGSNFILFLLGNIIISIVIYFYLGWFLKFARKKINTRWSLFILIFASYGILAYIYSGFDEISNILDINSIFLINFLFSLLMTSINDLLIEKEENDAYWTPKCRNKKED